MIDYALNPYLTTWISWIKALLTPGRMKTVNYSLSIQMEVEQSTATGISARLGLKWRISLLLAR